MRWTMMDTPVGTLRVVSDGTAVTAIEYVEIPASDASARSSVARAVQASAQPPAGERDDEHPVLVEAARQLRAYFAGELEQFDLPLAPEGTPFQLRVWEQLRTVGYGRTASYGQIAAGLGLSAAASRAVGTANGRNPIPIVIPCHRVVGADGTLTGYAGGVERKRTLLDLEQGALF